MIDDEAFESQDYDITVEETDGKVEDIATDDANRDDEVIDIKAKVEEV